jgi:phage terminase small subunit
MSTEADEPTNDQGFTVKQLRFIEEYCVDGNATAAAKRAGYSPSSAYSIGSENLKKPEIKAAIDERLQTLALGPAEVIKQTSEIAQSRLNDYFHIREVQGYEEREEYVTVLLTHARNRLKAYEAATKRLNLKRGDPGPFADDIHATMRQIIEYELEIERYGDDVSRLVPGRPIIIKRAELDLVALAEAKEGGRLKTYTIGKDGLKVEMYAADAALDKLSRMHGLYEKDNRQLAGTDVEITIGGSPSPEEAHQD